jgi:hypothetical protein
MKHTLIALALAATPFGSHIPPWADPKCNVLNKGPICTRPLPPAAKHKYIAVHGEEDFIEVVPTTEYTGLREKSTKTKEEVAERDLGDCKPGSWGC